MRNFLLRFFWLLAMAVAAPAHAAPSCLALPAADKPVAILFVGNSFTYFHNLPAMVETIGASNHLPIETSLIASGGATLADHRASGKVTEELKRRHWDYLVLQEQSSFGSTYVVNGKYRIKPSTRWIEDVKAFADEARKLGTRPVLLAHWPRRDAPEDAGAIEALYSLAAKRTGACIIRNSAVFASAEKAVGRQALYAPDNHHPSALRSYTVAAAIVRAISRHPLDTIPLSVTGEPIEPGDGKRLGGTATLITVEPAQAAQIRSWADKVIDRPANTSLREPAIPRLPQGERMLPAARLQGEWSGPAEIYPIPSTLFLTFKEVAGKLLVDFRLKIEGATAENVAEGLPVSLNKTELSFTYPKGPRDAPILFRGRNVKGMLVGAAHFKTSDGKLEAVGAWKAQPLRAPLH